MTISQEIITIAVVTLGTLITRFLPFWIFPEGKSPPAYITYLGTVLPFAAVGLLVVFSMKDAVFSTYQGLPEMIAVIAIVFLHKWKKNMFLSICGGTVLYMCLIHFWF